jgi:hypothetical protein
MKIGQAFLYILILKCVFLQIYGAVLITGLIFTTAAETRHVDRTQRFTRAFLPMLKLHCTFNTVECVELSASVGPHGVWTVGAYSSSLVFDRNLFW